VRPERSWLLAFRTLAAEQYGAEAAGQLTKLIAMAVAGQLQQGRQAAMQQPVAR
jgi:hypothetical protein